MHNIKLPGVLRFISILIILFLVYLYITLNALVDDIGLKSISSTSRKKYEYSNFPADKSNIEFIYNLESLFIKQPVPVIVETKDLSELVLPKALPSFQFVGMIETDKKTIYSFRNIDTNKLMLFEEGIVLEGISLIAVETIIYTFKKNGTTFQVDK